MNQIAKQEVIRKLNAIADVPVYGDFHDEVVTLILSLESYCSRHKFVSKPVSNILEAQLSFLFDSVDQQSERLKGICVLITYLYSLIIDGRYPHHAIVDSEEKEFLNILDEPELFWNGLLAQ